MGTVPSTGTNRPSDSSACGSSGRVPGSGVACAGVCWGPWTASGAAGGSGDRLRLDRGGGFRGGRGGLGGQGDLCGQLRRGGHGFRRGRLLLLRGRGVRGRRVLGGRYGGVGGRYDGVLGVGGRDLRRLHSLLRDGVRHRRGFRRLGSLGRDGLGDRDVLWHVGNGIGVDGGLRRTGRLVSGRLRPGGVGRLGGDGLGGGVLPVRHHGSRHLDLLGHAHGRPGVLRLLRGRLLRGRLLSDRLRAHGLLLYGRRLRDHSLLRLLRALGLSHGHLTVPRLTDDRRVRRHAGTGVRHRRPGVTARVDTARVTTGHRVPRAHPGPAPPA
ncbi:hypothetical protein STENM223S_02642 [Streptomyces tendae]